MIPASCCDCGTCCFTSDDCYVLVTQSDHVRLGEQAASLTHFRSGLCFMRAQDGHCVALEVRPDGQFLCSVYEDRPQVCRDFERGSPACARDLEQKQALSQRASESVRAYRLPWVGPD